MGLHKSLFTLASSLILTMSCFGQGLSSSQAVLDFGNTYSDEAPELEFYLRHDDPEAAGFSIDTFALFGGALDPDAFQVEVIDPQVEPMDSMLVRISFQPRHNIPYDAEVVIAYTELSPVPGAQRYGHVFIDLVGRGVYRNSYYDPTQDLSQEALKTSLTNLIDGHTSLGYSPARDQMYMVIDNHLVNGIGATQNKLVTAYTGRIVEGYADRSDAQTNYSVNTEHTWPQSSFSSNEPMRSDLFHIFVTDVNANSTRGSLPFGPVSTPDWTEGGSKRGGGYFEPRDVQKGPTSRAMLYFITRYGNLGSFMDASQEADLRTWHESFNPDSVEIRRNEDIYAVQFNRNPFIDYPQLTERISSFVNTAVEVGSDPWNVVVNQIDLIKYEGEELIYDFAWCATGNESVDISSWSMDAGRLFFLSTDISAEPGDCALMEIQWPAESGSLPDVFTDTLRLQSNSAVLPNLKIPISAERIAVTSVEELTDDSDWTVTQIDQQLMIQFSELQSGWIELHDLSGRKVISQKLDDSMGLSIYPELNPGIYFIQVISNSRQIIVRQKIYWK
jgi:endonuclease I